MFKKIFLIIISIIVIFGCSSCKGDNNDYIDISKNFEDKVVMIYRTYDLGHSSLSLVEKSKLSDDEYKFYKEHYSHVDFINMILIEYDFSKPFAIQFESIEKANEAFIYFGNNYFQHANCIFLDINVSYEFIYNVERNNNLNGIHLKFNDTYPWVKIEKDIYKVSGLSGKYQQNLERIILNKSVIEVAPYAFYNCSKLCEAYLIVKRIGDYAFYDCPLTRVEISSTVEYIGENAFNSGDIFVFHESKPNSWPDNFATGDAKVYWLPDFEIDANGRPYIPK